MSNQPSDLAPFVAAVIRDKVVMEQFETILELKAQLDASREIEVTGPEEVLNARGSFQDGKFKYYLGTQWHVDLDMKNQRTDDDIRDERTNISRRQMMLKDLSNLEIRLGGILFASSKDVEGTTPAIDGFEGETNNKNRTISFLFGVDGRKAWLTFRIPELPKEPWISLKSTALYNAEARIIERKNLYEMLSNRMSLNFPRQRVEIISISFVVGSVRKMICSLNRGPEFETEKRQKLGIW